MVRLPGQTLAYTTETVVTRGDRFECRVYWVCSCFYLRAIDKVMWLNVSR